MIKGDSEELRDRLTTLRVTISTAPPRGKNPYHETVKHTTSKAVENYIKAFDAESFIVQLAHEDRTLHPPLRLSYTPDQLLNAVGFLRERNRRGYNIYARPLGYRYILLDDLKKEVLADLAVLKPAVLIETSPLNYQAFLKLAEVPPDREYARNICLQIAEMFNADRGSAEPDHVGRLPGFTNRKPKHRQPNGYFPYVILHKHMNRVSPFLPLGGACAKTFQHPNPPSNIREPLQDRSLRDFKLCCAMLHQGKSEEEIASFLRNCSEKAKERGERYIALLLASAHRITGR